MRVVRRLRELGEAIPAPVWPLVLGGAALMAGWLSGAIQMTARMDWAYQIGVYAGIVLMAFGICWNAALWHSNRRLTGPAWDRRYNSLFVRARALWDEVALLADDANPSEVLRQRVARLTSDVDLLVAYDEARRTMAVNESNYATGLRSGKWRAPTLSYLGQITNALHDADEDRRPQSNSPAISSHDQT